MTARFLLLTALVLIGTTVNAVDEPPADFGTIFGRLFGVFFRAPTANPTSAPNTARPTNAPTSKAAGDINVNPSIAPSKGVLTPSPSLEHSTTPTTTSPTSSPTGSPTDEPTLDPTNEPTSKPTNAPTTSEPSLDPTSKPTLYPTNKPTSEPTNAPTSELSFDPTNEPTSEQTNTPITTEPSASLTLAPTESPSASPTKRTLKFAECNETHPCGECHGDCNSDNDCQGNLVCYQQDGGSRIPGCNYDFDESNTDWCVKPAPPLNVTYAPGDFSLNKRSVDEFLIVSNGLSARRIARSGQRVAPGDSDLFHYKPDGAATFAKPDGGWYYVSNAECLPRHAQRWGAAGLGGVGSIEFDRDGNVLGYRRIGTGTLRNCGGGKTPWNTWVTCEEEEGGGIHQTDPTGKKPMEQTAMGSWGWYETFAYDDQTEIPTFYVTRDDAFGFITRFTPDQNGMACYNSPNDDDRWCTLNHGRNDYLLLSGGPNGWTSGTFSWTLNRRAAERNANDYYWYNEGLAIVDRVMYFTSKTERRLYILDLQRGTYTSQSTQAGPQRDGSLEDQPDQIAHLYRGSEDIVYFCEDGEGDVGIHGRDETGQFYRVLTTNLSITGSEDTTGLAFSPDQMRMYVAVQQTGAVYELRREDGLPFSGTTLDIKYYKDAF